MQNRFKFRLYNKKSKQMIFDVELIEERFVSFCNDEDLVLMQCTGMKSTKGQLLYEGDIVRFFSCSIIDAMSERHPMEERIGQIVWNEEEMKFDVMVGGKAIPSLCKKIDDNNFELIGNIYENPELLEEKK